MKKRTRRKRKELYPLDYWAEVNEAEDYGYYPTEELEAEWWENCCDDWGDEE